MRSSRPILNSPRTTGSKQLKSISTLELNSYKIDSSSLSEKAKQVQLLKTSLQSQISQYKASEVMFHEEIQKLSQENQELRSKVKKLQTELNKIKTQQASSPRSGSKQSPSSLSNQIKLLKITISSLEDEVSALKKRIVQKNQQLTELQEYKKMYDIEVENKNNIMNFYQNKLALFKKDKGALISKYEQKISQLGSGLQVTSGTMIQSQRNNSSSMPNGIPKSERINQYVTQKNVYTKEFKEKEQEKNSSTKNIKFIRPPKSNYGNGSRQTEGKQESSYENETPYKLLKTSSKKEFGNKENTPYSTKSFRNELNEVSISSGQQDMLISRDTKFKQSPKNTNNLGSTSKTLRSDNLFLQFIKHIASNLRQQNIKSENLKNFAPVRNFINISSPLPSQVIDLLENFPFGPMAMDKFSLESCIQKMRNHLHKKYSTWSGSLLVELLIDKIEDIEIAYEVNSEEGVEFVAGLSSEEENN